MRAIATSAAALIFSVTAGQALADPIGQAASAKNVVTGVLGALEQSVATGDAVSGNETVKTGSASAALLKFLDDSKLNIGESSTVLLDRFVYDPNNSTGRDAIKLTKGAMRFVSGGQEAKNFRVEMPIATLVTRGTDFVVICDGIRCVVLMANGKVEVCPSPVLLADCANAYDLDQKRNFTLVGPNGENSGPRRISPSIVAAIIAAISEGKPYPTIAQLAAWALRYSAPGNGTPPASPIVGSPG